MAWLVSHLKATGRRTLTSHNLRSGVCPGAHDGCPSRTTPPAGLAMMAALETFEVPRQPVDSVGEVRARTTVLRTGCGPK